jgi:hypothetical protein
VGHESRKELGRGVYYSPSRENTWKVETWDFSGEVWTPGRGLKFAPEYQVGHVCDWNRIWSACVSRQRRGRVSE